MMSVNLFLIEKSNLFYKETNFNSTEKAMLVTTISYDDFAKLDLRVAKIESVEEIPGKTKIVKGMVNIGDESREVIIGGADYYKPEDLIGKIVIIITNLEPKKLAGIESRGMLLAADVDNKPYWLTVNQEVPLGSKIM